MSFFSNYKEKDRFKQAFADELLAYHFEKFVGKNEHNDKPWQALAEGNVRPHVDILCDLSEWFLARGWSREVVEELFFVTAEKDDDK